MDLEGDVPELRRGAGRRRRSSGLAEAQGVDEASQCVECREVKDRLGQAQVGGQCWPTGWLVAWGGGAGHIHLGQGRQIERFVRQ